MPPPIVMPTPEKPPVIPESREQIELAPLERGPMKPAEFGAPVPAAEPTLPTTAPASGLPAAALQHQVEQVLEEGLGGLYNELTPAQQQEFKAKGEVVAAQLTRLIQQVKVKVSQVLKLIRDWLLTIPGINRYFVEQEAKIKTDKLLRLH